MWFYKITEHMLMKPCHVRGSLRLSVPADKHADSTPMPTRGLRCAQVIGREREVARVVQVLARRTKNNPILLGEPGVGKTAIGEGVARAIVTGAPRMIDVLEPGNTEQLPCGRVERSLVGSLSRCLVLDIPRQHPRVH